MSERVQVRIVGGVWKRTPIDVPAQRCLRPTLGRVRITLFDWLAPMLRGAAVWDMFAGSGVLGFEAASRGAGWVRLTEIDRDLVLAMQRLQSRLQARQMEVLRHDARHPLPPALAPSARTHSAESALAVQRDATFGFDLFLLDPPFEQWESATHAALRVARSAARAHALVYLEAPKALHASLDAVQLAHGLLAHRVSYAGQVAFGLYRFHDSTNP